MYRRERKGNEDEEEEEGAEGDEIFLNVESPRVSFYSIIP